jgi:hypothetical protein
MTMHLCGGELLLRQAAKRELPKHGEARVEQREARTGVLTWALAQMMCFRDHFRRPAE